MSGLIAPVLNGLTLISVLMLVAIGLGIIFGLMRVINLAHGEFVTLGAFTLSVLQGLGGSYWMALLIAPLVGAAAGYLIERFIVRHLYTRWLATILATWGLSLILQQSLQLIFGAGPQTVTSPIAGSVSVFGVSYPAYRLFLILFAVAVSGCVLWMFACTRFGLDIRTVIQDGNMAEALGIDTRGTFSKAFMLGAALAAIAGVLVAPLTVVIAQMGVNYLAKSFFVVIVGGAGSFWGVAAGSGFVGGLETAFTYQMPVTLAQALVLTLAIVVLRFRPEGLVPHGNVKWD